MARKGGVDRGLFEREEGSGVWWIHYHDANGRKHREKVDSKGLARKVYMQRKTEIAEGRYFPNARRRAPIFADLLTDYREAPGAVFHRAVRNRKLDASAVPAIGKL